MSEYTDEFLLKVVNSCGCPVYDPEKYEFGYFVFDAIDGWKVEVFYKGGQPEYLDRIVDPTGLDVDCWDDNNTDSRDRLLSWNGVQVAS